MTFISVNKISVCLSVNIVIIQGHILSQILISRSSKPKYDFNKYKLEQAEYVLLV